MSDIASRVTADMGPAVRAVQAVTAAFAKMGAVIQGVHAKAKVLGTDISKNLAKGGQAASRIGGIGGAYGAQFGGAFGMSPGFAKLAALAVTAGIALKAFNRVQEVAIDRVRKRIEAENALTSARDRGRKELESQSAKGEAQSNTIRKVFGLGGDNAVKLVDDILRNGVVTNQDQAATGVLTALKSFDKKDVAYAVQFANELAAIGGDFPAIIEEFAKGPTDLGGLMASQTRMARELLGVPTADDGQVDQLFRERLRGAAINPFLRNTQEAAGIRAENLPLERERATRLAVGTARQDLARARDPVSAAIGDLQRTNEMQLNAMERMVDAQSGLLTWFQETFGTGLAADLIRTRNAQAGAAFAPGG